jgi:predicted transposase YbfD/YdcC
VLKQLLGELDLEGVLIQADTLLTQRPLFQLLQEQGADFLLTVKANQKTLYRQIRTQFKGKRKIPLLATDHEKSHGRDITWTLRAREAPEHISQAWIGTSWIVEVTAIGTRDANPFHVTHLFLTSLRTTPEGLLQLVRDRWIIEGSHLIRDTQLQEDAHRYRGKGAGAKASLRTANLNLLRIKRFQSIRAGMQAVKHDITALLAMALRQPNTQTGCHFESALGGAVIDAQVTLERQGRQPRLVPADQVDRQEPYRQGEMRTLQQRARRERGLQTTGVALEGFMGAAPEQVMSRLPATGTATSPIAMTATSIT